MIRTAHAALALAAALPAATALPAHAEPFTYQGSLHDAGAPANGVYDFIFELYSDPTAGGFIAAGSASDVTVENGVFTFEIDIDVTPDSQQYRWLQISVRPDGPGPFTALAPRQFLSAAPFASVDLNEPWTRTNDGFLGHGTDTQSESVLINRDFRISPAEHFGIGADTDSFAGMYAWTSGDTGQPFYGYSAGGSVDAYSYYAGASNELRFHVNGADRLAIDSTALETSNTLRVVDGASTKFFVDPSSDQIRIGDNDADTNVSIVGDPFVSGSLTAQQFVYSFAVETSVTVLGSSFVPEQDGAVTHSGALNLTWADGPISLLAGVDLPVGANVQSMEVFVNDQSSNHAIDIDLRRRALNSPAGTGSELVASFTTSIPGSRNPTQGGSAVATGAVSVRQGDAFYLDAIAFGSPGGWPNASSVSIRGVRINYTVSRPD